MNIEKIAYVLTVVLTEKAKNELSLPRCIALQDAWRNIIAKAEESDLTHVLFALIYDERAVEAAKDFDAISKIFSEN